MGYVLETDNAIVIRFDYSDDTLWRVISDEIDQPVGEFRAKVAYLEDQKYSGLVLEELPSAIHQGYKYRNFKT